MPADDLSRQALAAQAEDLATEDALVVLDRALGQGALPTDAYLRQVRAPACMVILEWGGEGALFVLGRALGQGPTGACPPPG